MLLRAGLGIKITRKDPEIRVDPMHHSGISAVVRGSVLDEAYAHHGSCLSVSHHREKLFINVLETIFLLVSVNI